MEFPALLVFDDQTLKPILSEEELCSEVELSCCNTTGEDYFVNVSLQRGQCLFSDEDKAWKLIDSEHCYSDATDKVPLDKVKLDLESALNHAELAELEVKMAKEILEQINTNNGV